MNEQQIREQLGEISYAKVCKVNYLAVSKNGITKQWGIDMSDWKQSQTDIPEVEIFFVPQVGEKSINLTKISLPLLLDAAGIPPSFIELLRDNNGILHQETTYNDLTPTAHILQVKLPVGPYINGLFYWRYEYATKRTTMCIFFSENLYRRLEWILDHESAASISPFMVFHALVAVSMRTVEAYRQYLDSEVCRREASTGTTLVTVDRNRKETIEQYPPLFDSLHHVQQELLYFDKTLQFQIKLIKFLHQAIEKFPFPASLPLKTQQHHKVLHAIGFNLSQAENAYDQVQTLVQRIRIQLDVVRLSETTSEEHALIL